MRLFEPQAILSLLALLVLAAAVSRPAAAQSAAARPDAVQTDDEPPAPRWWRGNLHTHTLWSDGDGYPEMVVDWYRRHGYHFLALSDHNILSVGQKWVDAERNRGGKVALERYRERFGEHWVERRVENGKAEVRLKPLNEFRSLFEEPDRFLLIQSEELTDHFGALPVHLVATNLLELIPPPGGSSVLDVLQNNVNAVREQRRRTGQPMFPHIAHPNFGWALTAEDIARVEGERFFEVYNGHPQVRNYGDAVHASTDRMWDIILTQRLGELGTELIFGVAVDDAHNYHGKGAMPGRGWVVVRARRLTPESIIHAMEAGDFYASTGVRLREIRWDGTRLSIEIEPEEGVTYTTKFIGTRRGYDRSSEPVRGEDGQPLSVTRRYSSDVGAVLAEATGTTPGYTARGDELYVRAKIVSSKPHPNPFAEGDVEVAWTQPVQPKPK